MGIDIIVIIVLVICSAFFSATETAFTSANRIRLKNMANDGNRRAETALALIERYDELLSTILVGNNIANTANTAAKMAKFRSGCFPRCNSNCLFLSCQAFRYLL